jgi:thymidylate synthase (FAD)
MKVLLNWVTPHADENIAYMARVSNPNAKIDDPSEKLIKYLIDNKHWSPFEMVCMCVEIQTTRDISRQLLRHRSFHFQEFSQRYAVVVNDPEFSKARMQDKKNRQNSYVVENPEIDKNWLFFQETVWDSCCTAYNMALNMGIAKELARKLLPEGLTQTRMYMQGTVRDWIHYLAVRTEKGTQREHQDVALVIEAIFAKKLPQVYKACCQAGVFIG